MRVCGERRRGRRHKKAHCCSATTQTKHIIIYHISLSQHIQKYLSKSFFWTLSTFSKEQPREREREREREMGDPWDMIMKGKTFSSLIITPRKWMRESEKSYVNTKKLNIRTRTHTKTSRAPDYSFLKRIEFETQCDQRCHRQDIEKYY